VRVQLLGNRFVVFIGVTAITLTLASCQPVDVDNYGFETPVVASGAQLFEEGETLGAWEVTQGSVDVAADDLWQAREGRQSLDMTGVSPGAIAQDLATVPGNRYAIAFSLAGNPLCGPSIKRLVVEWDGVTLATLQFDITGRSAQNMGWVTHQIYVTPTASTSRLQFRSRTEGSNNMFCGPALDKVAVADLDAT
jgi:choice-of-anchor C domain-containing protein